MSNIAILYQSKSGYTKKYAQWLAEKTGGDLLESASFDQLKMYDTIVIGGGLYAGKINGAKKITKHYERLKDKRIILFGVCLSTVTPEVYEQIKRTNVKHDGMHFFLLRGGFDYSKCTPLDKFMMNILKKMVQRKKVLTNDDKGMLAAFQKPIDLTNIRSLDPIIECIQGDTV